MNLFWRTKPDAAEKSKLQNISTQTANEQQVSTSSLAANKSQKTDTGVKKSEPSESGGSSWWKFWQRSSKGKRNENKTETINKTNLAGSEIPKDTSDSKSEELLKTENKRLTIEDVPDGEIANMVLTHLCVTTASFIPFSYITQRVIKHKESKMTTPFTRMHKFLLLSVNLVPVLGFSAIFGGAYILYKYEFEEKSTKMGEFMRQEKMYDNYMGSLIWPLEIPKKHPVEKQDT